MCGCVYLSLCVSICVVFPLYVFVWLQEKDNETQARIKYKREINLKSAGSCLPVCVYTACE